MTAIAARPEPIHKGAPNEYGELKRRVKSAGLLEPQPAYYWVKTLVALGTLAASITIATVFSNPIILLLDAVFLGFAFTQTALLAHDVGHWQGYRGRRANAIARFAFGNVVLGVSHSWWNVKHNQHHATPNHVDMDPDIQFPMLAFSREQLLSRPHWLRPLIAVQAFVLLLLLPFQAINMRISSVMHLRSRRASKPWLQLAGLACHVVLYTALLVALGSWTMAFAFFAIQQAVFGLYNSSVFASNHKGMPVIGVGGRMDFLREQVLTSRNISGHPLTDFWYGGLNYQIEHHLFPTMPRNNLSKAVPIVRSFCGEREISYHSTSLFTSYREVLNHLHEVSAPLRSGRSALT